MRSLVCAGCGSKELNEEQGLVVCVYCGSRFAPDPQDASRRETVVALADDIEALLRKCRADPANRRRLANLVLDLDPSNQEARHYL